MGEKNPLSIPAGAGSIVVFGVDVWLARGIIVQLILPGPGEVTISTGIRELLVDFSR